MKLYAGKFLVSYVHRKSVLRTHGEQREGWSAEHPILWVHRVTERSIPKCKNARRGTCSFLNPETSVNYKNRSGKIKLYP